MQIRLFVRESLADARLALKYKKTNWLILFCIQIQMILVHWYFNFNFIVDEQGKLINKSYI